MLLVVYLGVFHLWTLLERPGVIASGLTVTALLVGLFLRARRTGYFLNGWDAGWHASVILDVLLEATLIPAHGHVGFYLCAIGFVVFVGGYHAWRFHRPAGGGLPPGCNRLPVRDGMTTIPD